MTCVEDIAYRSAEAGGDATATAEAALELAGLWLHEQRSTADHTLLLKRLRRALAGLDPESPLARRLRLRLTAEVAHDSRAHADTLILAEQVRHGSDVAARAEAAHIAHQCVAGPDHAALRHSLAEQLIADGTWHSRRGDVLLGLMWRTVNLVLDGNRHAYRSLHHLRTALAEDHHPSIRAVADGIDIMRRIRAGQLDTATIRAGQRAHRDRQACDPNATERHACQLVAIRWYQGRIGELTPMLADLVDSPDLDTLNHSCLGALALAAATAGQHRQARQALARLRHTGLANLPHTTGWLATLYYAVEAAYLLDDKTIAAEAYDQLMPYADRPVVTGLGYACLGSVHHTLGMAALIQDQPERAVAHLTTAVHTNLSLWHWPAAVITRTRLAEALHRRGHHTDHERAAQQTEHATGDAAALGLPTPRHAWPPVTAGQPHQNRQPHRPAPPAGITCRNCGRHWEITAGHRTVQVGRMRGMQYLAILIANPGREIPAAELAAGPDLPAKAALPVQPTAGQPVLDDAAVHQYRNQLANLDRQIHHHETTGDLDQAERLRTERAWLIAELATVTGLSPRPQAFSPNDERARIAVGKAIRRAINHIARLDPTLGQHLRTAIHTGTRCVYQP